MIIKGLGVFGTVGLFDWILCRRYNSSYTVQAMSDYLRRFTSVTWAT